MGSYVQKQLFSRRMISGAVVASICAAFGSFVQLWDSSAIGGALLYLGPDLQLDRSPQLEGAVISITLFCAVLSAAVCGPTADWLGRRVLLINSALLYLMGGFIMACSTGIYQLLLGRAFMGAGNGIVVSMVPLYIAETSPPEIRGQLATLPQLSGVFGLLLAYTMDFVISIRPLPNWHLMVGAVLVPACIFLCFTLFGVLESPRWLVSKGHLHEAKEVLQMLRNREDVTAELAMQLEGLNVVGPEVPAKEWLLKPADEDASRRRSSAEGVIKIVGRENSIGRGGGGASRSFIPEGISRRESFSHHHSNSFKAHSLPVSNVVAFLESAQEVLDRREEPPVEDEWEVYYDAVPDLSVEVVVDGDTSLREPLLKRDNERKELLAPPPPNLKRSSPRAIPQNSRARSPEWENPLNVDNSPPHDSSAPATMQAERGQFLVYQREGSSNALPDQMEDGSSRGRSRDGGFYLRDEGSSHTPVIVRPSLTDVSPECVEVPDVANPATAAQKKMMMAELMEPGVRHALVVGVGLQLLRQASGVSTMLSFTPLIFKESGADFMNGLGLSSNSASILFSWCSCVLMLPCIALAMHLMDRAGRRQLLLATTPVSALGLMLLALSSLYLKPGRSRMLLSLVGLTSYMCSVMMGLGPIPSIFASEIFPTRARGLCMSICTVAQWLGGIVVSQSFPVMLKYVGLPGIFSSWLLMTCITWVFVYIRVPETKGLPLEVIIDFFSISSGRRRSGADGSEAPQPQGQLA